MLTVPFLVNIGGAIAFWSTFWTLFVFGFFSGIFQGAVFYDTVKFPQKYFVIFMTAQGIAGIAQNFVRLLSLRIYPPDKNPQNGLYAALICFVMCSVFLLLAVPA